MDGVFVILTIVICVCVVLNLIFFIYVDFTGQQDETKDDSQWNIDKEITYNELQKYTGGQEEKIVGVLGIMEALKALNMGTAKTGFCILTNEAIYIIADVYKKIGKYVVKAKMQQKFMPTEFRSIGIETLARKETSTLAKTSVAIALALVLWWLLFFGIIHDTIDVSGMIEQYDFLETLVPMVIIYSIIHVPLVIYSVVRAYKTGQTFVCMYFSSETVAFHISTLGAQEIKNFFKEINVLKNSVMDSTLAVRQQPEQNGNSDNKIDSLMELSKLHKQEIISKEEFEALKAELLNG